MKKVINILIVCFLMLSLAACANNGQESSSIAVSSNESSQQPSATESSEPSESFMSEEVEAPQSSSADDEVSEEPEETAPEGRLITVRFGEETVVYELNDSPAASSLLEQLPITIEVEDYSTNEKIFYPSQELNTANTPTASGGAGTLAYYAPWGDVVMFYGDYNENPSLFELGRIVSGGDLVSQMSGTITIDMEE